MEITIIIGVLALALGFILGVAVGASVPTATLDKILADKDLKMAEQEHLVGKLRHELEQSKQLKDILEILVVNKASDKCTALYVDSVCGFNTNAHSANYVIPDNVLQYVDDILGGKVIKQDGNKCLVIAKDGTVKTGITKAKTDKGYTYKLVRE